MGPPAYLREGKHARACRPPGQGPAECLPQAAIEQPLQRGEQALDLIEAAAVLVIGAHDSSVTRSSRATSSTGVCGLISPLRTASATACLSWTS